ncbi:DUF397 domain-containing protein [Amycolatopsis vancoresmycina]|uniref:DUF397 domain-containing protein n=1 Tax=Amycolatopsis vancoresmycina DSM 44592 TaxID=1292037 RepID=R1I248_9PSEU|nr:DUF397 domain-containing protein [Amycolatopsis vancoresmycina]EOD69890.1 hypothetical protein H480_03957 [Amycolatopsis vancoresmycina DSM 44592]
MSPNFATATFKTSSYTESNGTCVEVAVIPGYAAIRDTKDRAGGHIAVPAESFAAFLAAVRS